MHAFRVDAGKAIRAVREYNAGGYHGRTNLDIDRTAYARFRDGVPRSEAALIELVRFVGEDFGGALAASSR